VRSTDLPRFQGLVAQRLLNCRFGLACGLAFNSTTRRFPITRLYRLLHFPLVTRLLTSWEVRQLFPSFPLTSNISAPLPSSLIVSSRPGVALVHCSLATEEPHVLIQHLFPPWTAATRASGYRHSGIRFLGCCRWLQTLKPISTCPSLLTMLLEVSPALSGQQPILTDTFNQLA
jgi:hypothetical protein